MKKRVFKRGESGKHQAGVKPRLLIYVPSHATDGERGMDAACAAVLDLWRTEDGEPGRYLKVDMEVFMKDGSFDLEAFKKIGFSPCDPEEFKRFLKLPRATPDAEIVIGSQEQKNEWNRLHPTANSRDSSSRSDSRRDGLSGEICIYEGPATDLLALVSKWAPVMPVTSFPATCVTPDGVLRCLTEDMTAVETVDLVRRLFLRLRAKGFAYPILSRRLHPSKRDDGGAKLAALQDALGFGGEIMARN